MERMTTAVATLGLCLCGCGTQTPVATRTRKERGTVKGQPFQYSRGHAPIAPRPQRREGLRLDLYRAKLVPGEPPLAAAKRRRAEAFRVEQKAREQARRDAEVAAAAATLAREELAAAPRATAAVPKPEPALPALPKPETPGFLPVAPVYVGGIGSRRVSFFGPELGQNPERVEPRVSIRWKRASPPRAGHGYGSPVRPAYRP